MNIERSETHCDTLICTIFLHSSRTRANFILYTVPLIHTPIMPILISSHAAATMIDTLFMHVNTLFCCLYALFILVHAEGRKGYPEIC